MRTDSLFVNQTSHQAQQPVFDVPNWEIAFSDHLGHYSRILVFIVIGVVESNRPLPPNRLRLPATHLENYGKCTLT